MKSAKHIVRTLILLTAIVAFVGSGPGSAHAHCDSLDGPVAEAARHALEAENPDPVLRWVRGSDEPEIRRAFEETLAVRKLGDAAMSLADRYFLETLVRVHREGEGAPYTGLKPAGGIEPAVAAADQALSKGDVDTLAKEIATRVEKQVREKFGRALRTKGPAEESVEAGREHVAAYVEYVHFVESLHAILSGHGHNGEHEDAKESHR